ncbi:MAG TPA: ABC transporter substrate-binding protein [Candidatus Polarisedimenticolaceae bacterium]|nr:ABC transporter substrate-binding protein [Candidatus Polarisedimenticolaceae bacterium]
MSRALRLAVLLASLAGCGEPARIGAIVSRSGAAAAYGEQVRRGFDLAVGEINADGGVRGRQLELLYRDDATNPDVGLSALRDLVDHEHARIVLGAVSSSVTLQLAPYCERRQVLLLSPSASAPQITSAGDFVFRTYPSDVFEAASMADFARDLGLDRVAVLAVDTDDGASLASVFGERFRASGGGVVAVLTFPEGDQAAIRDAVEALSGLNPRGVYVPALTSDLATVLTLLRSGKSHPIVLGTSTVTPDLVRLAGPASDNLVFPMPSFDPDADDPTVRAFVSAYRTRYGTPPDVYAAHAYDAVRVLATAVERAGSWEVVDVRDALLSIDHYEGVTGHMAFDRNGDIVQYPRLYVARGGRFLPYDRFIENGGSLPIPGRPSR